MIIAVGLLSGPIGFGRGGQSAEATLSSQVKRLLGSDAEARGEFGFSVAVSGDTAIVGAREPFIGATGTAYVFQRDQGGTDNWGEVKRLVASDAEADGQFGFSVAISGDTAIVGAGYEDAGGSNAGAAYVFGRDEGGTDNWGEVKKLTASDPKAVSIFGRSVAIDGDTAFVGASQAGDLDYGAVYVFGRDEGGAGNWGEAKKLTAFDAGTGDWFGHSVALDGDTAIVGARFQEENPGWGNAGAAYVFGRDQGGAGNWGEVKKLRASDPGYEHQFGYHVTVSGDTAVVGAGPRADAAYVFGRDQGGADNWGEVKKLTASGGVFGGVGLSGDTAVVGAAGGAGWGAAYVFGRDRGGADNWGERKQLTASGGQFGWSVAVDGGTAVVGARTEGGDGAAYVFDLPLPTPAATPTVTPTACPTGKVPAISGCGTPTPTPTPCPTGKVPANAGCGTPTPTPTSGAMEVDCDANAAGVQNDCSYAPGASFQVEVHVKEPPTGGYLQIQVKLGWTEGVVSYLPTVAAAEEALWPECDIAARIDNWERMGVPSVFSGCAPLPSLLVGDTFTGAVYTFEFQCQGAPGAGSPPADLAPNHSVLNLVSSVNEPDPHQGGTIFVDALRQPVAPALTGATVTCAEPPPTPLSRDTDGDGCSDAQEEGPSELLGGRRDYLSFWDFFDTPAGSSSERDQVVNMLDVAAVVLRFGTVGDPRPTNQEALAQALTAPVDLTSYHAAFDRGEPIPGENVWNAGPADGAINVVDLGAAIVQFGHTCA